MLTARDPKLLDLVTWGVASGAKLFQQVRVTEDARLIATAHIPHYDFAVAVPARMTFSILDIARAPHVPTALRVSPSNYASPVKWFPGANWGMLSYAIFCTSAALTAHEPGRSAQMALVAEHCATDNAWLTEAAMQATQSPHFDALTEPIVAQLKAPRDTFNESFALMYCGIRRTAVPVWSATSQSGASFFATSAYARGGRSGDVLGSVPFLDLARHSSRPSCVVGLPDPQMLEFLVTERGAQPNTEYYVLQTTRGIMPGEELTVDRNASLGFNEEDFERWMGRPWSDEAAASLEGTQSAGDGKPAGPAVAAAAAADPPKEIDPEDLFF